MIFSKKRLSGKKRLTSLFLSLAMAVTTVAAGGIAASASPEMAAAGVYVKQMGSGYCTLASAVDMMRSKMYLEGNSSWPNVTQQGAKSTAWLNGAGLYHQFTYYGMKVTYSTSTCNTTSALINLLKQHPEGIEIYIRDLPHAVLLTRYDSSTGTFYVADPVYEGERTLMQSWDRKAGSTQAAVISTIDAYWYISSYAGTTVPGGLVGPVASSSGSGSSTGTGTATDSGSLPNTGSGSDNGSVNNNPNDNSAGSGSSSASGCGDTADDSSTAGDNGNAADGNSSIVDDNNVDAAGSDSSVADDVVTDNNGAFVPVRSTVRLPYVCDYSNAAFQDVSADAWYAGAVKSAYEMAMMNGVSESEFLVSGNVTIAQSICMAARIHSIYYNDGYDFTAADGEAWYMPYVNYARANNMLAGKYDFRANSGINYDQEALRVQFAEILSAALPDDQLTALKQTTVIPDVPAGSGEARFEAVYQLYNAGVLNGDGEGFKPWRTITRAEVAAVVSRMGDATLRIE